MTFVRRRDTLDSGPGSGRCSLLLLCAGAVLETRLPHFCAQGQCWRALGADRGGHYGDPGSFCAQARDLRGGLFILVRRRNTFDPPGKPMPEGQDVSGRIVGCLGEPLASQGTHMGARARYSLGGCKTNKKGIKYGHPRSTCQDSEFSKNGPRNKMENQGNETIICHCSTHKT